MDPDPRKEIEVDPDLDPERGLKWIRIRIRNADYKFSGDSKISTYELYYLEEQAAEGPACRTQARQSTWQSWARSTC